VPPPDASREHYLLEQQLAIRTSNAVDSLWSQVDPTDLDGSWAAGLGQQITARIAASQFLAASIADRYLGQVLDELTIAAPAAAAVRPRAFAGIAADGRPLDTLAYSAVVDTKLATSAGRPVVDAMAAGRSSIVRIAGTQVADAGRTAVATAIAARPAITTWVRMLNPPSCSRCVVLAGKHFKWNQGFARHPLCDCVHIPVTENIAGDFTTDPRAYFDRLSPADQAKYFTEAGAQAIRRGADIAQTVNARRGLYFADGQLATIEGTTSRGYAGKVLQGRTRLMPETLIRDGATRAEVIAGLRANGYLT
jgi:hypothetical protein